MRCSCQVCGTYMVQSEGLSLGCVCPECGQRCHQCLGTNTVVSKDNLKAAIKQFTIKYSFDDLQNAAVSENSEHKEGHDDYDQYRD